MRLEPIGNCTKRKRNKINIEMRNAKSKFFFEKIRDCSYSKDLKKSWSLINNLLGKNTNKTTNISELSINSITISEDKLIAESFKDYFINIGPKLAAESNNTFPNPLYTIHCQF